MTKFDWIRSPLSLLAPLLSVFAVPAGAVCPHDDYLYAGQVYLHAIAGIHAPRVLLVGVFHAVRLWNLEGHLVFDCYTAWHAPLGPVRVDSLREELLAALPEEDVVIDDGMQDREHSLEAIVPFLQWYGGKDKTIVPVLVPYVSWQRLGELADHRKSTWWTPSRWLRHRPTATRRPTA